MFLWTAFAGMKQRRGVGEGLTFFFRERLDYVEVERLGNEEVMQDLNELDVMIGMGREGNGEVVQGSGSLCSVGADY